MKLHPFMIEAIYLRQHPEDILERSDGKLLWFDAETNKYMWSDPNAEFRKGPYEARGLQRYWDDFSRLCEEKAKKFLIP